MQTILVGTSDGLHVLGPDADEHHLRGREVTALTRSNGSWWAILEGREILHSGDFRQWSQVTTVEDVRANCLLDIDGKLLVGTSSAHLSSIRGGKIESVETFNNAPGRDDWHTPWGGPPDVRSMSAAPDGTVYANVHVGGVVRSIDGGDTWDPTIDINADVHQVSYDAASGRIFAACAHGLAVSDDEGVGWNYLTDGLHAEYCRAVAVAGDTVLVSASTGPFTNRSALYRTEAKGSGEFHKCEAGLPEWFGDNIDTYCVDANGAVAAFGTSNGSVFVSEDAGESWRTVTEGLASVRCVALS